MKTENEFFKAKRPWSKIKDQVIGSYGILAKIHYKEYPLLTGTEKKLVERVNDGSIITRFDKTPQPKNSSDVVCPDFLELKWAYGVLLIAVGVI